MRVSRFFSLTVLLFSGLSFVASSAEAQTKQPAAKPPAAKPPAAKPPAAPPATAKAPAAPAPAKPPAAPATAKPGATTTPTKPGATPTSDKPSSAAQTPSEQNPGTQTPQEKAEALVIAGRKLIDAHESDKAVGLLEEAHGILGEPESGFELMRAYDDLGKLVEAITLGEKLVAMPVGPKETQANTDARKKIKDGVDALSARLSTIQLQIQRPTKELVRVKVDDRTLLPEQLDKPIRVNPGKREILITAPGYQPLTIPQNIEQGPAKQYPIAVNMEPVPAPKDEIIHTAPPEEPPSAPLKPLVKVGIGVSAGLGVVAIATGIGAGVSYVGFVDAYNRRGCGADCDAQVADRRPTLQALSITWPIAGALAIAGGTLTWVYARNDQKSSERASVTVVPTAGGILVHGRW